MKNLRIEPIGTEVDVATATNVINALLDEAQGKVKAVCGGKGLCATCHVRVLENAQALSPLTAREQATLELITGATGASRLACQAKVLADGCVLEVPRGIYLESLADLESLIGRRAEDPFCHPISGAVLVPQGKIITRSVVMALSALDLDVVNVLKNSDRVM